MKKTELKNGKCIYSFIIKGMEYIIDANGINSNRVIDPIDPARLPKIIDFINKNFHKRKTISTLNTSYGLKHYVEHRIGYISNGEFIAAMLMCGFIAKPVDIGYNPINCYFNIAKLKRPWRPID